LFGKDVDDGKVRADGREMEVAAQPCDKTVQSAIATFCEVLTFAGASASQTKANGTAEAAGFMF
jgi:hypothetical protein